MLVEAINNCTQYIKKLDEKDFRTLFVDFLNNYLHIKSVDVHSNSEHGIDILGSISNEKDSLKRGYNLLIQTKTGDLSLSDFRSVLTQIIESGYYEFDHQYFVSHYLKRIIIMITGKAKPECNSSLKRYNKTHGLNIELFEIQDIINLFSNYNDFIEYLNRLNQKIGSKSKATKAITVGSKSQKTKTKKLGKQDNNLDFPLEILGNK